MPLYEVVIIEHPTKKDADEGIIEKLVFGPKAVVAKNPEIAGIMAVQGDGNSLNLSDRAQVIIRPFA